jgi:hypothetical protein
MVKIKTIQSPDETNFLEYRKSRYNIFLAGGISNCENWQEEFIRIFSQLFQQVPRVAHYNYNILLFNPRRVGDLVKEGEAKEQILWEDAYLRASDIILFWFPAHSICPIALFELGKYATKENIDAGKIFVGADPKYTRRFDLDIQLNLINPKLKIYNTLNELMLAVFSKIVG